MLPDTGWRSVIAVTLLLKHEVVVGRWMESEKLEWSRYFLLLLPGGRKEALNCANRCSWFVHLEEHPYGKLITSVEVARYHVYPIALAGHRGHVLVWSETDRLIHGAFKHRGAPACTGAAVITHKLLITHILRETYSWFVLTYVLVLYLIFLLEVNILQIVLQQVFCPNCIFAGF